MNIRTRIQSFFKKWIRRSKCKKYGLEFPVCCKAHGVGKRERQGALAQSRSGDELQLVHIALDEFPFNVYVYSIELNRILGYLEETLAKKLVLVFGQGFCLDGRISEITGGPPEYEYFGCNIRVFDTMNMMLPYLEE